MDETRQQGGWTGPRVPFADEAQEERRTAAYWEWLAAAGPGLRDGAPAFAGAGEGRRWVRLASDADADYEAFGMKHSIGHSWDKYSALGPLYSLRDADNRPLATVLVANGAVVHAREQENARLSPENQADLEALAARQGWTVKADELPFDVLRSEADAPNTRVRYLHRGEGNAKTVATAVLAGRLSDEQVRAMADGLLDGRAFLPVPVGLADLSPDAAGGPHELLSVKHVRDEPTPGADAAAFHAAWTEAAEAGWDGPARPACGR